MKTSGVVSHGLSYLIAVATSLTLVSLYSASGAVNYSVPGSTYSQNFDSLPNTPENVTLGNSPVGWTDDNAAPGAGNFSIVGWYLYHPLALTEGGFNSHQRVRIGAGTANTGGFMSFGSSASTDRALGDVGSNTLAGPNAPTNSIWLGLRLNNNTGVTLDSFTLTYNGEQWRDGGAATPNAQTMNFMWSTTATAISDPNTSFNAVATLNFTSPVFANTGSGAAVDGNAAGRVNGITATVTGINWLAGTDLWLRWDDINHAGNDHGLAIDDLVFSAEVPEPSTVALLCLASVGLLIFRRRK
jgi:hypothetical protein